MYPEPPLLRKILAARVPVSFSSDAHTPADVGWGYEHTVPAARECGVIALVTFEKRRKTARPLPRP